MSYTIPQIPVTATSIGTTDLFEIAVAGSTSAQVSWASVLGTAQSWTAAQTVKITDSATATVTNCLIVSHDSSGTPAATFGTGIKFQGQDSTTADQDMAAINAVWTTATHASRSSQVAIQTVSNAGALSTGLIVGSGISGATAYPILGGLTSGASAIWASSVTPATNNYAISITSASSMAFASGVVSIGTSLIIALPFQTSSTITKYNNINTAGIGVPAIYASANITAQSTNATITSYANPATDAEYEVSATVNVTVATAISTTVSVTYTDVNNSARTLILPVQQAGGTGGTYLTNGLIIAVGDYSTPVHKIRVKASTTITILTAAGTFTGVTYSASGTIKQTA